MRICLFSSYYIDGAMPYHVRVYLTELSRHFDRVMMLTNKDKTVPAADRAFLDSAGIDFFPVVNEGYDFGMWTKAVIALGAELDNAKELCLANDSCLLIAPLDGILAAARASSAQVYGLTESHERGPHLQSYFLLFKDSGTMAIRRFLGELGTLAGGYNGAIDNGEVALSRVMSAQGLHLDSYFKASPDFVRNPMSLHAATLVRLGMPLLKRKQVRGEFGDPVFSAWHCREIVGRGGSVGVDDCRRLLVSTVGMQPIEADTLMAAEIPLENPAARIAGWRRQKIKLFYWCGRALQYAKYGIKYFFKHFVFKVWLEDVSLPRPEPLAGVWLA